MWSLVTNLNISITQEIVNWVTTADGCVHTVDTTQLDFAVGKFVQTRQLRIVYTSPTQLNSTVESRRRHVLGIRPILQPVVVFLLLLLPPLRSVIFCKFVSI